MNAIELKKPDGTPAGFYLCAKCGVAYRERTPDVAERCCRPYICSECGQEVSKPHRTMHDECAAKKRIRDGVPLESWAGWVWVDDDIFPWNEARDGNPDWAGGYDGYHGDGYFESVEYARKALAEMVEEAHEMDDEFNPYPAYVHPCSETPFRVDADIVLENATEELYYDAFDDVNGKAEFYAAVDALNKANENMVGYYPMYRQFLRLDAPATEPKS